MFVLAEEGRLCSLHNNTGGKDVVEELETMSSGFSTAPFSSVDRKWQVVGRHQWREVQSMPVLEGRAALHAIRHTIRSRQGFGMRHVILTDSMTAAVAYDKGRASSYKLRRVLEQASALTLASGSMFRMRWIPSEWNPADRPSQGGWGPSEPEHLINCWGFKSNHPRSETSLLDCKSFRQRLHSPGISRSRRTNRVRRRQEGLHKEPKNSKAETFEQFAEEFGGAPDIGELSKTLDGFSKVGQVEGIRHHQHGTAGFTSDCLSRVPVPGGRGPQCGKLVGGFSNVSCAGVQRPFNLIKGTAIYEGVAKIMPTKESDADTLGGSCKACRGSSSARPSSDCSGLTTDVFLVPAARGSFQDSSAGHCSSSEEGRKGIQVLFHPSSPNRAGHSIEDSAVGRDARLGLRGAQVLGALAQALVDHRPKQHSAFAVTLPERFHEGQFGILWALGHWGHLACTVSGTGVPRTKRAIS